MTNKETVPGAASELEKTRKIYPRDSFGRIKAAGRKCVLCGTSSDSITMKVAVFCNFDLTYLPCCLHPTDIQLSLERAFHQQ
jgi:hypothetical protein